MGNERDPEPQILDTELWRVRAHNAVLQVAARHDDLLQRGAFEELATTLSKYVPLGRLSVVVPDGQEQILYAASVGDSASPLPPFGARFPLPDAENRRIVMGGTPRVCSDTRAGDVLDRQIASFGYLSYAALPIREPASGGEDPPIVAKLIVCFAHVNQAAEASLELMEATARLFGARFPRSIAAARERRLAMIVETSGDAMLAWDRTGRIGDANAAAERLTGSGRAELIGRRIQEIVEGVADAEPRSAFRTRIRALRADGTAACLPVSVTVTRVQDDPIVAAHMLARDISHVVASEREAAEQVARVRALEEEHRALLDNAPLVIFRLDPRTAELSYVNRHAEVLLGISQERARDMPSCLRAAHVDAAAAQSFDDAFRRAQRGLPLQPYEARLVKPDGEELTVRGSIYAITKDGEVVAVEGILADISAEHAARTQLVQTDRLATLGRLAASVAHEINNPAAFIMLGLEHLERSFSAARPAVLAEDPAASLKLIRQLRESLERIATIVRDLRLFAGPLKPRVGAPAVSTEVHRAVQSALTLTRTQLVERARLMIDLEPVPPVLIEEGRLAQVVVNLLVNAAQAIPKDGAREHRITIGTRADADEVQIEVSDTGVGVLAADQARIWTPFFTTKDAGSGTGLGLSISRDIVDRAGGRIEVISPAFDEPGAGKVGSRFIVHLKQAPVTSAAASRSKISSDSSSIPHRATASPERRDAKHILIVEDELVFGHALAEELRARHHVTLARGGAQALELLRLERFDIILCDVRMPGISGETLYARICASNPAYRASFIFMTGLGFGTDLMRLQELYRCPILEKPFAMERLLHAIDDLG